MKREDDVIRVLAADCQVTGQSGEIEVTPADSGAAVLTALRYETFDLLITGCDVAGVAVWLLAQKVRCIRPKLLWWLVAHGITHDQEILARTLGVSRILGHVPTPDQIRSAWVRQSIGPEQTECSPALLTIGLHR